MNVISTQVPFYRKVLLRHLEQRQRTNPRFSLRSYARLLEIQPPTLSAILNGKRPLPKKYGRPFSSRLRLSPIEKDRFLKSLGSSLENDPYTLLEDVHRQIISQWEYYAILALIESAGFKSSARYISLRLGISLNRAKACLQNLVDVGLISIGANGKILKTHADVKTSEDVASAALRESHQESLTLAKRKLETLPLNERDFSSGIFVMPSEKIPEAKKLIREFRKSFYSLMEDTDGKDVFHICIQFFPLTNGQPR